MALPFEDLIAWRKARELTKAVYMATRQGRFELRSQLYVAHDVGYIDADRLARLLAQAEEVARVIGGLRASLGRSE